jgi:hypothetical protein
LESLEGCQAAVRIPTVNRKYHIPHFNLKPMVSEAEPRNLKHAKEQYPNLKLNQANP